ncbi:uncharacterized protein B0I36DRAFT_165976 [Microdochium trichocladiopsis]|uniref:BZIP domain-containing protein n=1 Tax=Microdochium trichocladiopsis TaxID=1682393 RepID=A0A9P8Y1H7_9PEZI|nr:uncharacterized protein B0I36DRAFT_165976 [Microdochium trichocladiopsis]KAH7025087.1 hypothetical protein B0I36DRAFT_165976 [Microdochium trichocladiopsis]
MRAPCRGILPRRNMVNDMIVASKSKSDNAKTSRLTLNKRRYRARQKEYVSDLERKITEAREQGISATIEVQLAARKVIAENERLRELLLLTGFDSSEVELWAKEEKPGYDPHGSSSEPCLRVMRKAQMFAASMSVSHSREDPDTANRTALPCPNHGEPLNDHGEQSSDLADVAPKTTTTLPPVNAMGSSSHSSSSACSHSESRGGGPPTCTSAPTAYASCKAKQLGPCKLVSRLAENPMADLTQIAVAPTSGGTAPRETEDDGGGVECGKAYTLLMRYATSEEKIESVARALEGGCTSTEGGGCAVKKDTIWKALDELCG